MKKRNPLICNFCGWRLKPYMTIEPPAEIPIEKINFPDDQMYIDGTERWRLYICENPRCRRRIIFIESTKGGE